MFRTLSILFLIPLVISMIQGQAVKVLKSGLTAADQENIVKIHNSLRLPQTAEFGDGPSDCNAKIFQYDQALAAISQQHANKQSGNQVRDSSYSESMKSKLVSSSKYSEGSDWKGIIHGWFKQNKYSDPSIMETIHYNKVACANTVSFGCGYSFFQSNKNGKAQYSKFYECNYRNL